MRKHLVSMMVGVAIGAATFGGVAAFASTPKPSGYCTISELGKVKKYTTPSKSATYNVKCVKATTQKWKKA
jgi:uncharacterized protein YcfJ